MNRHLNYDAHVSQVWRKCTGLLIGLSHVRHCVPRKALPTLVNSLVISLIQYCLSIYGSCTKRNLLKLQRVVNFGARVVAGRRKRDHISVTCWVTFNGCQWLSYIPTMRCVYWSVFWQTLNLARWHRNWCVGVTCDVTCKHGRIITWTYQPLKPSTVGAGSSTERLMRLIASQLGSPLAALDLLEGASANICLVLKAGELVECMMYVHVWVRMLVYAPITPAILPLLTRGMKNRCNTGCTHVKYSYRYRWGSDHAPAGSWYIPYCLVPQGPGGGRPGGGVLNWSGTELGSVRTAGSYRTA